MRVTFSARFFCFLSSKPMTKFTSSTTLNASTPTKLVRWTKRSSPPGIPMNPNPWPTHSSCKTTTNRSLPSQRASSHHTSCVNHASPKPDINLRMRHHCDECVRRTRMRRMYCSDPNKNIERCLHKHCPSPPMALLKISINSFSYKNLSGSIGTWPKSPLPTFFSIVKTRFVLSDPIPEIERQ